eukprot:TRINITY_DN2049_c0_g1_i1.p1 TRINITY_DN2049_c0_g1~~TRINITY_DN2049_c0_g1_i1.p1  ORF type:complete len:289 (-),score=86.32 TRINITY_DN2049_c0_g1_i1:108-974(-)
MLDNSYTNLDTGVIEKRSDGFFKEAVKIISFLVLFLMVCLVLLNQYKLLSNVQNLKQSAAPYPEPDPITGFIPIYDYSQIVPGEKYNLTRPSLVGEENIFKGKKIGLVMSHGAEDVEIIVPAAYFKERGADVKVVAPSWNGPYVMGADFVKADWMIPRDMNCYEAKQIDWDALLYIGGMPSAGVLKVDGDCSSLFKQQVESGRSANPICAANEILIPSGYVNGRKVTGPITSKDNLEKAGGIYVDPVETGIVVNDDFPNLISCKDPHDSNTGSNMYNWLVAIKNFILK